MICLLVEVSSEWWGVRFVWRGKSRQERCHVCLMLGVGDHVLGLAVAQFVKYLCGYFGETPIFEVCLVVLSVPLPTIIAVVSTPLPAQACCNSVGPRP